MANNKTQSIVAGTVLRRIFGITAKTCDDRGVIRQETQSGTLGYDIEEVVNLCGDLILGRLSARYQTDDGQSFEMLKIGKLREETRRLKIDNDARESLLVPAADVEIAITKGLRAIADALDSIPVQFVMENPDVPPAYKDSLNRTLIDVRNKLANTGINYD